MMDLFPCDEVEDFLHTFLCFKGNLFGVHHRPPLVYLLITNRGIYLMNHVHESRLFALDIRIEFEQLRHIIVSQSSKTADPSDLPPFAAGRRQRSGTQVRDVREKGSRCLLCESGVR